MVEISKNYKDYLNTLNKTELTKIVKDYHLLCNIFDFDKETNIEKKKKEDVIEYIYTNLYNYLSLLIKTFDSEDYKTLKVLLTRPKKVNDVFLVEHRDFINLLLEKKLIIQKENIEIPFDVSSNFKNAMNYKDLVNIVNKNTKLYKVSEGIIVAYGLVDLEFYSNLINSIDELGVEKIKYYYKKDYKFLKDKVLSNKLSSKKRINNYFANKDYKVFSNKELLELGNMVYHHSLKCYKKFIKRLKNYYVFKSSDIMFIDKNIIIPYLYNSLNEENEANNTLEETVLELFEFKGDKLKEKILEEIKDIRNYFPIWEYRGKSKNEVK